MAYKKDQGRYARMTAFWSLFLLIGYGCLGGLVYELRNWFGPTVEGEQVAMTEVYIKSFPLLGDLDLAMVLSLAVLAVIGIVIHSILSRPTIADMLIDTELEMRKVTWPTGGDTWTGTLAVITTVVVLLVYLWGADLVLAALMGRIMGGS